MKGKKEAKEKADKEKGNQAEEKQPDRLVHLQELSVSAPVPIAVDTRSGNQVFKQDEFQGSPTLTTSQILQQAIAASGGIVFKTVGDAVHAVFTTAPDALDAALAAQHAPDLDTLGVDAESEAIVHQGERDREP